MDSRNEKFIVMKKWLDSVLKGCSEEQAEKICYRIIMFGLYGEKIETDDAIVEMALDFIYPQIDNMLEAYNKNKEVGQNVGRKKKFDDDEVYELACQGKTGTQIAEALGISPTSVYMSEGWKKYKKI